MAQIRSYRDLEVWQRSMEVVVKVYHCTQTFPQAENYGLTNQIRRSSVSVPSNIAEGHVRPTKDFARFLNIAMGSVAELETQLELAHRIGYLKEEDFHHLTSEISVIGRKLNTLISRIRDRAAS
jgi:four helix bundle protein